jgi:hypothetical protein
MIEDVEPTVLPEHDCFERSLLERRMNRFIWSGAQPSPQLK